MRRLQTVLLVVILVLGVLAVAVPLSAHTPCEGGTGRSYGEDHVASHTPHGPPDEHHNPGTAHQGYSACDPDDGQGAGNP